MPIFILASKLSDIHWCAISGPHGGKYDVPCSLLEIYQNLISLIMEAVAPVKRY